MILNTNKFTKALRNISFIFISMLVAMMIGSVFLVIQGENPFEVYYYLFIDPFTMSTGWIKVVSKAVPLMFTGLAAALAFRCGIFNIGIEGQLYMGALAAAVVGFSLNNIPKLVHIALAVLAAASVGGLWALIAGWLKVKLKVHEVISTIMLNYIATNAVTYLLISFFRAKGPTPKTHDVAESARFMQFAPPEHLNTGVFLALILVVVIYIVVKYLPLGWKIDSSGKNMEATKFSGINSKIIILIVMFLSGAIASMGGVERVLGAYGYMELGFSPGYGFDGLAVAIIARNNPVGVVFVALLFGLMYYGGININMMTNVTSEWVLLLIAIMLILVAAQSEMFSKAIERAKLFLKGGRT